MSFIEGVSQCWWLSETCAVDWEAWSAIGTLGAVIVALRIANKDKMRRWQEADGRAGVAYAKLVVPMRAWLDSFRTYADKLAADPLVCLTDNATAFSLRCPEEVIDAAGDMRDLGPASEPTLDAMLRARQAVVLERDIEKILTNPGLEKTAWGVHIITHYSWCVMSAARAADTACNVMETRLNRVNASTPWKTRYVQVIQARYRELGLDFGEISPPWWAPRWLVNALLRWDRARREVKPFRGG